MGKFLSDKKNIVICLLALILVVSVGICGIVIVKKNKTIEKKNAIITNASAQAELDSSTIEEKQKQNDEMQAQINDITGQNESLTNENNALREQLAAKKKAASDAARKAKLEAEAAQRAAAAAASAERTQTIISALSLPPSEQAAALPNVCYLTFDDGPSDVTLSILNTLATYNVKATFFVKGNSKLAYLPNIVAGGHTIGLHSDTHNYNQIYASVENYLADLQAISQKVEASTGVKSAVMRFPGGSSNKVSKICPGIMTQLTQLLPQMGYSYFDWNVSSGDADGNGIPATTLVNNVLNGAKGKSSICVLMHDTNAKSTTAQALPSIIEGLYSMGFRFEALTPQTYGYHHSVRN